MLGIGEYQAVAPPDCPAALDLPGRQHPARRLRRFVMGRLVQQWRNPAPPPNAAPPQSWSRPQGREAARPPSISSHVQPHVRPAGPAPRPDPPPAGSSYPDRAGLAEVEPTHSRMRAGHDGDPRLRRNGTIGLEPACGTHAFGWLRRWLRPIGTDAPWSIPISHQRRPRPAPPLPRPAAPPACPASARTGPPRPGHSEAGPDEAGAGRCP